MRIEKEAHPPINMHKNQLHENVINERSYSTYIDAILRSLRRLLLTQ